MKAHVRCPSCNWQSIRQPDDTDDYGLCLRCQTPVVARLTPVQGEPVILPPAPLTGHRHVLWSHTSVPYYRACMIIETYGTHTAEQQATLLGLALPTIYVARKRLIKVGLLCETQRLVRRPYSPAEIQQVRRLMAQGWTATMIQHATDMPLNRIWGISERYVRPSERPRPSLTMQDVVNLFGVSYGYVYRWVRAGWLTPAQQHLELPPEKRPIHIFYRDDLFDFVRLRDAWMTYDPARITDPELRRLAETARATAGGRWVQLKTIVAAHQYSPLTLNDWRSRGWPGPTWEVVQRGMGNTYWLWLPNGSVMPEPPPDKRYNKKERAA